MFDTFSRKEIGKGVFLNTIVDTKFKSNRLSINLVLPLNKQTAAQYALIPFLLRKGYKDCPDFTKLNARLAELYGASLDCDVRKAGDNQILNLSIQGLDNRFALQQEDITC